MPTGVRRRGEGPVQPREELAVSGEQVPLVEPEEVLVEDLAGLDVPEATGVGGDLVGEDHLAARGPPELELEVHEIDPGAGEQGPQLDGGPPRLLPDGLGLGGGGEAETIDVVVVDHWVAQVVALVIE